VTEWLFQDVKNRAATDTARSSIDERPAYKLIANDLEGTWKEPVSVNRCALGSRVVVVD
jgi:hypothetical protein